VRCVDPKNIDGAHSAERLRGTALLGPRTSAPEESEYLHSTRLQRGFICLRKSGQLTGILRGIHRAVICSVRRRTGFTPCEVLDETAYGRDPRPNAISYAAVASISPRAAVCFLFITARSAGAGVTTRIGWSRWRPPGATLLTQTG
jgi:hypothetical protein